MKKRSDSYCAAAPQLPQHLRALTRRGEDADRPAELTDEQQRAADLVIEQAKAELRVARAERERISGELIVVEPVALLDFSGDAT